MKRSEEEEIKRALQATISGEASADDDEIISDAISELLALRRRMLEVKQLILAAPNMELDRKNVLKLIESLTEGKDGE